MPQPQKYERSRDFTKQEAHKTDHAGINAELDNAATTIDALRVRQALLLNDQDQLRAKLIQRVNLSDGVIEDITSGVASGLRESVESAQSAARASLTFAEDATTQAAQALRSATQAQTTLDAAAITVAQAQAAMRDAGDVLGFVQQHAAATDPHPAYALETDVSATLANYAPLASPALTGTPTAPTATAGTNTAQIATTAFVRLSSPASLASNGYQKLPSGLIIQWGELGSLLSNTAGTKSTVITFPVSFPTGCLNVYATPGGSDTPLSVGVVATYWMSSGFGVSFQNTRTDQGVSARWLAIGY